jgi:pSer/pThr/pTyr-binding forkhead associated (FHA) protein
VSEPTHSDEKARQKVFALPNSRLVVGRGPESDIMIHDSAASRGHGAFSTDQTHVFVESMAARAGIFVNGNILLEHRLQLRNGDVVKMGDTRFEILMLS